MIVLQTIAVAFAMFSAIPVPQFDWNEKNMRYALCAFPLVGVVCGALWCVCGVLPLPAAARAAGDAAGAAANAFVALAVSIYLLSGKENLLHAAHTCLRAALSPRAAGSVLAVCTLANRIFSGYLGGQLVDALLVAGCLAVGVTLGYTLLSTVTGVVW